MEDKEILKYMITFLICIVLSIVIIVGSSENKKIIYVGTYETNEVKNIEYTKVKELQEENANKDIKGYLTIPGTNISEPVLQGTDNEFYLSHGVNKKKNIIGSVYLDYRVKINEGRKNLIYSHNSSSLTVPFKKLEKYYDEDFYKSHQYIFLEDENSKQTYQIFSIFVETKDWSYMSVDYNDEKWLKHLNNLKEKSWYDTGINVESDDEILILQTCSHHKNYKKYKNKYLLVIAKKIWHN